MTKNTYFSPLWEVSVDHLKCKRTNACFKSFNFFMKIRISYFIIYLVSPDVNNDVKKSQKSK